MLLYLLLFSASVLVVGIFPQLPPLYFAWLLIPLFWLMRYAKFLRVLFTILLGLAYGIYTGQQLLLTQLLEKDSGKDFFITGKIAGLPKRESKQLRFWVDIESIRDTHGNFLVVNSPKRVQLSWYFHSEKLIPEILPGERWQLSAKLHRPRSMVNPTGFDYQLWLLRKGIGATGYVVKGDNYPKENISMGFTEQIGIWRYQLQQWVIEKSQSPHKGILIALLIGDSGLVEKADWKTMQQTGTNHLIAISGLHVGFLAIIGFYLGLLLGRVLQLIQLPFFHVSWPAQFIAYVCASLFAGFYSALAGFNIPTVRTLLMLSIFYWVCLWRRQTQFISIFCLALVLVILIDPLAAYDIGFWLSFGAVAFLLLGFSGRREPKRKFSFRPKIKKLIQDYCRSQWLMLLGLLVPLIIFIGSFSLTSPIANAVAIPVITFFVVPCLLVAAVFHSIFPMFSNGLIWLAESALEGLLKFLQLLLQSFSFETNPLISLTPVMAIWLAFCSVLMLLPRGFFPGYLSATALCFSVAVAMLFPKPNQPDLRLLVLDVGQGTSVVVQVANNTLVYDTGARFSDNFDAGSGIIAPYLKSQAIGKIDKLIVSHNDLDHAGGLSGLLETIKVDQLLLGQYKPLFNPGTAQKILYSKADQVDSCHEFPDWQWQSVSFRFLKWPLRARANANNYSCVLQITYQGQVILIPGDLEREVEMQLLDSQQLPVNIQLLLAGHHGSLTSSNPDFIEHLRPKWVVYSAGYANRYGHPHPLVRQRFRDINSQEFLTAEQGAVEFSWKNGVHQPVLTYRQIKQRYWY